MIKSEKGKVEIRGTYSEICADYFCIAKAIESSSEESKRFKATIILKAITENKIKKENLEKAANALEKLSDGYISAESIIELHKHAGIFKALAGLGMFGL